MMVDLGVQEAELEDEGEAARLATWDAEAANEAFQSQRRAAEEQEAEAQRKAEEAFLVSAWSYFGLVAPPRGRELFFALYQLQ